MSDETTGLLLMAGPILWLAYRIITARAGRIEFRLEELLLVAVLWLAGRILARKGVIDILLSL